MSEFDLIEVVVSSVVSIRKAAQRRNIMLQEVNRELREIDQMVIGLDREARAINNKSMERMNDIVSARIVSINRRQKWSAAVLDKTKKLLATVNTLSNNPELKELDSEIKTKMPHLQQVAEEARYLINTSNIAGLHSKAAEINKNYEQMLNVLRNKDMELSRTEIRSTSLQIRDALQEIGFHAIKEISGKEGTMVLGAKQPNSTTTIFAEVNRDNIKLDTHGFKGSACSETVDALLQKLKERGITARRKERIFHNKEEGGELVKEVKHLFDPLSAPKIAQKEDSERQRRIRMEQNKQKMKI